MFNYNAEKNTIETEHLVLRRFVLEDAEKVAAICNTEEVWRGTLALPHPYTVDCGKSWIQTHDKSRHGKRRCPQKSCVEN